MKAWKIYLIVVVCLSLGSITTSSQAQLAPSEPSNEDLGAGAKLVVTFVRGPAQAVLNHKVSVTYRVKNNGDETSGAYQVRIYLSRDRTINPANDRLLGTVSFTTGLGSEEIRKTTSQFLVPINGLSGSYYYGAVVASSKKASLEQVAVVRFKLGDNNETVVDHKTGLTWQSTDDGELRTWANANQYCVNLVLGNKADWRLPKVDELLTIVDYTRSGPSINPVFDCRTDTYWATQVTNSPGYAWYINFEYGNANLDSEFHSNYVRCVRGVPW